MLAVRGGRGRAKPGAGPKRSSHSRTSHHPDTKYEILTPRTAYATKYFRPQGHSSNCRSTPTISGDCLARAETVATVATASRYNTRYRCLQPPESSESLPLMNGLQPLWSRSAIFKQRLLVSSTYVNRRGTSRLYKPTSSHRCHDE